MTTLYEMKARTLGDCTWQAARPQGADIWFASIESFAKFSLDRARALLAFIANRFVSR